MDGVRGVKVAAEWNGIFPALQGGRGNDLLDRTDRSDARNVRFIYQRSFSYSEHAKLEGGSQTGGTVQQALKKKQKTKQQQRCFSWFKSHAPLTIGDGDSQQRSALSGGSIQRDAKTEPTKTKDQRFTT